VPAVVLEVLAPQLGLLPMPITDYPRDEKTRWTHLERIRRHRGFTRCDRGHRQQLLEHLTSVARAVPRTDSLRRAAHTWLLEHYVVRPGRTTLRDLVATARETGLQQTFDALTRDLIEAQRSRLDELLATADTPVSPNGTSKVADDQPTDALRSRVDRFKVPPHRESPAVLLGLLECLETIEKLGFCRLATTRRRAPRGSSAVGELGLPLRRLEPAPFPAAEALRRAGVLPPGASLTAAAAACRQVTRPAFLPSELTAAPYQWT
jgi:hypothetical protein